MNNTVGQQSGMVFITFRVGASSEVGAVVYNGSGTNYNTSSDYRLKFDIKDLDENEAVERMKKLRTRTYRWKKFPEKLHRGFIAHELEEDWGLCVTGKKDEVDPKTGEPIYQGIDTKFMMADMCACVKYCIKQNEILKEENENLKNKNLQLEERLKRIEQILNIS